MDFETLLIVTFAVACMTLGGVFVILKDLKLQINELKSHLKQEQREQLERIDERFDREQEITLKRFVEFNYDHDKLDEMYFYLTKIRDERKSSGSKIIT